VHRRVPATYRPEAFSAAGHLITLWLCQEVQWHQGWLFFRKVVENQSVSDATLITQTKTDKAVGIAYLVASALAKDNAAGLGDASDRTDPSAAGRH
jgi:hypothetical protein